MNSFINTLQNYPVRIVVVSVLVIILTNLLKVPIKSVIQNSTEKLKNMLSVVIIFIPLILSFCLTILNSGLFHEVWFSELVFSDVITSWLLSLSLYSIVSKLWALVTGVLTGKTDIDQMQKDIQDITSELNLDKETLTSLNNTLSNLVKHRDNIISNNDIDMEEVLNLDFQIKNLEEQKSTLNLKIVNSEKQMKSYKRKLKK